MIFMRHGAIRQCHCGMAVLDTLRDQDAWECSLKSSIRPTTPEDAPAISELLWEVGLRPNSRSRDLSWKYWEAVEGSVPRSFVLTRGKDVLAHAGIVPRTYAYGSDRLRVLHVIDWAAHHYALGAGVLLMKQLRRFGDVLLSVGGSSYTRGILPQIGFDSHGTVFTFVRALRPMRILQPSLNRPAWKLLPRLARNAFWSFSAPVPNRENWEVRQVLAENTQNLAGALPTPSATLAVLERTPRMLGHALMCPISPMELYALEQHGIVRGYFLLAYPPAQVRLADCWINSNDPGDWGALVDCAVHRARENRSAAEFVAYASDPRLSRCLEKAGFHLRGVQSISILAGEGVKLLQATLRIQMLDNDAAYHHMGKPEFAA